ncbi:MAG: 5-formyltetrahydrofolate cyclo-ligase [Cyclobacteriaceae bacterium]|nr:5-formyltetrahydrofolate cyclo-ligase [Cyclobacteriaceae bacterium SS2]
MNDFKTILRKQVLPARKILSSNIWEDRNRMLASKVIDFINQDSVKVIHSFLPIERNKEVNTWPIIKELISRNLQVVVSSTDLKKEQMLHYYYHPQLKFRLNRLKIPEPINAETADTSTIDLVLIPLLAADKKGNRIGYGKGYYDRLLQELPKVKKVGLTLGPLFDEFDFAESHDIKLDYCITPFEIYQCQ